MIFFSEFSSLTNLIYLPVVSIYILESSSPFISPYIKKNSAQRHVIILLYHTKNSTIYRKFTLREKKM